MQGVTQVSRYCCVTPNDVVNRNPRVLEVFGVTSNIDTGVLMRSSLTRKMAGVERRGVQSLPLTSARIADLKMPPKM